ncbi:type II and III secretion system protein family protein [Sinorhizobium meliloti]|uniref:type II and III secretion system protein family protein n=1 Tax=Rhizobium meliloti TaxID=382 RepID=UPI00207443B7|nr:type II and III secretion system protein family protein [Sinorhizobium meliloti]MCM5687844.1 type II and III secretion system protein family protein [Sinorhizobium meliloti]
MKTIPSDRPNAHRRPPPILDPRPTPGSPYFDRLLCALILSFPVSTLAQDIDDKGTPCAAPNSIDGTMNLSSSLGETVHLPAPATTIFVADPTIADYQLASSTTIFVFGKKSGRTSLFALDDKGQVLADLHIVVTQPIKELRAMLRGQVGGSSIHVSYTPRGAILSGTAANAEVADTAKRITEQYIGDGAQVVNNIKVDASLQVNLSVRVVEVSRSAMKALGVNLSVLGKIDNFRVGLLSGGGAGSAAAQGGGSAGIGFNNGALNIGVVLDALAKEHIASVLAEPNLTAMSGETASFLAGGELPTPVLKENGQASVEFRHFGVSLEFVPTVLSNNQINIRVKSEVSELTSQGAVQIKGISVPALSTRRADTVVELASGRSFAIGGLFRHNVNNNVNAFRFLGEIPVLGALFRSPSFQKEESELIILVTPYIVRPGSSPKQMSAPTDRIAPALVVAPTNSPVSAPRDRDASHTRAAGAKRGRGFIIE